MLTCKKQLKISWLFILVVFILYTTGTTYGAEVAAGAVNNWFSVTDATSISVDMTPNWGEGGYHYYSLSPFFQDKNYGLYSGIQTNGDLGKGTFVGNMFIFSIWNATVALPENGVTSTPFGGEGIGYSLRKQYDWKVGDTYTVTIKRETFDPTNKGWRWSSTIKHKETDSSLKLGEIVAPTGANALTSGSAFHERFSGTSPNCSSTNSNLEKAGVKFSAISSDKSISFNGTPAPNDIFTSSTCRPYLHMQSTNVEARTGFGITAQEFNNPPPKNQPSPITTPKSIVPDEELAARIPDSLTLKSLGNNKQKTNYTRIALLSLPFLATLMVVSAPLLIKMHRKKSNAFMQHPVREQAKNSTPDKDTEKPES